MIDTFIKLDRSLLKHRYFDNVNVLKVWLFMLMKASHKPHKHLAGNTTVELEAGSFVFGRIAAARDLKMTEQTVRTIVKLFENDGKITIKTTNKYSIITVVNFTAYQVEKYKTNQQNNQQLTINQPSTNQQLTTNKNEKNEPKPSFSPPEWIDEKKWQDFIDMRIRIKKPMTERAKELAIGKLEKIKEDGFDPNESLDNSTFHDWQDIYPPKKVVPLHQVESKDHRRYL